MRSFFLRICLLLACSPATWAATGNFLTKECELRLGESVMIPIRLDTPATATVAGTLRTNRKGIIEILRQPEFLSGHSLGFARIRTTRPGSVEISYGTARLKVRVRPERPLAMVRQMRPRFTSPSTDSHAWGTIAIGAEMWVGAPGIHRDKAPHATLHLPDGRTIQPAEAFPPVDGPFWRLVFRLDTSTLSPGRCPLTLTATPSLQDGVKGDPLTSEPLTLHILPPAADGDIVLSGECENTPETPRTERMGVDPPGVIMDPGASHFRAVTLCRNRPAWMILPDIPTAGRYQLMVRARGALAASAYPSLRILLGKDTTDSNTVRLSSTEWQEVPVGPPVQLDAGPQWIGITLANEFQYRNQIQRSADLDRYTLRHVPDAPPTGSSSMMMAETMMKAAEPSSKSTTPPPRAHQLRVAFTDCCEGEMIRGRTQIHATLSSPSLRHAHEFDSIRSELWINQQHIASAYGQHPALTALPHDFKKGKNSLQIRSISPYGDQALSLTRTLTADSASLPRHRLHTTYQAAPYDLSRVEWQHVERTPIPANHPLAGPLAPGLAHILKPSRLLHFEIPRQTQGERRISLFTRTLAHAPAGRIKVKLFQPDTHHRALREIALPEISTQASWAWQPLASVELSYGRKFLTMELSGGEAAIGSCSLDTEIFIDAAPPAITLLYPRADSRLSSAGDAVVVRASDDLALSHFNVWIDGAQAPLHYPADHGTGPFTLSIPGSLLKPGTRRIEVVATDESGKTTRTKPIRAPVHDPTGLHGLLPYPRAIRLATTLGTGVHPKTIADILTQGEAAWLKQQLAADLPDEPLVDALSGVWFRDTNDYNVRGRVVTQLLNTRFPVRARFCQFAQNHFSTWISKTGADAKWREHQAFYDVGFARFQDLLLTSATSPAMMIYLDQQSSFGKQLNENYARELMELHTVGVHAGYQQQDVIQLAKLLSGWGAQREATMDGMSVGYEYRYSPYLAEPGPLEVFGLSIPAAGSPDSADDRVRLAIEMLAARPQTARFFSEKMAAHYLGLPTEDATVSALEKEFLRTGGNLRSMMTLLAQSPAMMAADRPRKLMSPVEFAIATQRSAATNHPWSVIQLADRSGRNLFDRASPDGFPEDNDEYADSNYQLQKWRYCKELEWQLRGNLPHSAFAPAALADASQRDALIDLAFASRLGAPPADSTRAALHQALSPSIPDDNQRRHFFTSLLCMMPEFQSR